MFDVATQCDGDTRPRKTWPAALLREWMQQNQKGVQHLGRPHCLTEQGSYPAREDCASVPTVSSGLGGRSDVAANGA